MFVMLPNINPQFFIVNNFNKTLTKHDLTFLIHEIEKIKKSEEILRI